MKEFPRVEERGEAHDPNNTDRVIKKSMCSEFGVDLNKGGGRRGLLIFAVGGEEGGREGGKKCQFSESRKNRLRAF